MLIPHDARLETRAEVQVQQVRFGKILERHVPTERFRPVDPVLAFRIGRQRRASDLHHTTDPHVGVMRAVRLREIKHLVELPVGVIQNRAPIELHSRLFPGECLSKKRIPGIALSRMAPALHSLEAIDVHVIQEQVPIHAAAAVLYRGARGAGGR